MLLYPTETIYALGVNPFDAAAVAALYALKGRAAGKACSWLVRDQSDVARYAAMSDTAAAIVKRYLPSPVTLVLPALPGVPDAVTQSDGTVSFRISTDPHAARLIAEHMTTHDAPLTCTSANVSGQPSGARPAAILDQFVAAGRAVSNLTVRDDGVRVGKPSTVVRVVGDDVTILRQGSVTIDL